MKAQKHATHWANLCSSPALFVAKSLWKTSLLIKIIMMIIMKIFEIITVLEGRRKGGKGGKMGAERIDDDKAGWSECSDSEREA